MLCTNLPSRVPVAFKHKLVQQSEIASSFADGLPRDIVRVNGRPQPLQRHCCQRQACPDRIT